MNSEQLEKLCLFFLEAAGKCYTGKQPKGTIEELPNSKVYRYARDPFFYIDAYHTNGEYSGGQTLLYHDAMPVWQMQYQGWCKDDDPETIAFLKAVLNKSYAHGIWSNGRGSDTTAIEFPNPSWQERGFRYLNHMETTTFDSFRGKECITEGVCRSYTEIFWHRYQGILFDQM